MLELSPFHGFLMQQQPPSQVLYPAGPCMLVAGGKQQSVQEHTVKLPLFRCYYSTLTFSPLLEQYLQYSLYRQRLLWQLYRLLICHWDNRRGHR
jgi:hypothetical protein